MAKKLIIGSNEVTVPEKTDIATQISTAISGKLDKVTTSDAYAKRAYAVNTGGNPEMQYFGTQPDSFVVMQRKSGGLFRLRGGNTASRPITGLDNGDQYYNTDSNQLEVYIGDTNHWLNQVYKNGDTLPTPASGTSHTYQVIDVNPFMLAGPDILLIDGDEFYEYNNTANNSTTIVISNNGGMVYVHNMAGTGMSKSTLTISSTYLGLKRVA